MSTQDGRRCRQPIAKTARSMSNIDTHSDEGVMLCEAIQFENEHTHSTYDLFCAEHTTTSYFGGHRLCLSVMGGGYVHHIYVVCVCLWSSCGLAITKLTHTHTHTHIIHGKSAGWQCGVDGRQIGRGGGVDRVGGGGCGWVADRQTERKRRERELRAHIETLIGFV